MTAILKSQTDAHFGDFNCVGEDYGLIPDLAVIDDNGNLLMVWEAKVHCDKASKDNLERAIIKEACTPFTLSISDRYI